MTGKLNSRQSWEKQTVYNLDNKAKVTVEYSIHYGESIARIDLPDGTYWHCSNGVGGLPEFAKPWIEEIKNAHGVIARMVRPLFDRTY